MKFIVSSSALLKKTQLVAGALNTSNTLPILDNFLFEIKDGELSITASDLETTMTTKMPVEAKENGNIAIPAKLLTDTLKSLPDQPLTFSVNLENSGIEISSDFGKYKLTGFNGSDFPKTPELDATSTLDINSIILSNAITKTIFATGNDELRPVMNGVYLEINNDNVTFVATDAHKLVKYMRTDVTSDQGASFILPKKPLNLLKNILASFDDNVTIEYNETNARFVFDETVLICRLIEGKYPNYQNVIPVDNPNKLTIDRVAFANSIKRVSIFANKSTHQIRLKITGSELTVSGEDLDFSNEANERLTCSYEGEDMEIGFNGKFLLEMLNNLDSDEILIELSAPNRAGLIFPVDKVDENEQLLMLVMPVMLNS